MGLFSKKPKPLNYNVELSEANKKKMREMFNDAVSDGDTYKLLYAYSSSSQIEKGFYIDKNVTTFYFYILGWRESDNDVVLVDVDADMTCHGEPSHITMDQIKETNYYKKLQQAWFIYKDGPQYGVSVNISDCSCTAMCGLKNLCQEDEREQFLDFLEAYTEKLRQMGYKIKKWKR